MIDKKKQIDITGSIIINKNNSKVFAYFSNFFNDPMWRKEINETEIKNYPATINTIIKQDSFLSTKIPHLLIQYKCTEFVPDKMIVCETTSDNKFWQRNTRITEAISENSTKVIYRIQFDIDIVKYGLGFYLPTFLIKYYTRKTMKKYLKVLRNNIEY